MTNLQKVGWGGPPTLPAQRTSTSESHACTSTAISCGDYGSCGVECTGERPPTVASESDCGSSKVRGSSSSIIDPHLHDCHCLRGSASRSISPCSSPTLPDNDSPCSSKSTGSSSSRSPPSPSACPSSSSPSST